MPRSSSSHSSKSMPPHAVKPFHTTTPSVPSFPTPTTGQLIKESMVSGVGSGIGFSAGTRIMNSLFGPTLPAMPQQATTTVGSPTQTRTPMERCVEQMALHSSREDLTLCLHLLKEDMQYREFQQCMKTSDNNTQLCKDFLPSQ